MGITLFESEIDRAKELLNELEQEMEKNISTNEVPPRILNLTQETLTKIILLLDKAMYEFFKKNYREKLSEKERKEARIYFPIASKREDISNLLARGKMQNLEKHYPHFFNLIESLQPYHPGNEWLKHLKDITPERHSRLTPQTRHEIKQVTISNEHGTAVFQNAYFHASGAGAGVTVLGTPIDLKTQLPVPDGKVKTEVKNLVSFVFEGSTIDALWLCRKSVKEGEKIVKKILDVIQ